MKNARRFTGLACLTLAVTASVALSGLTLACSAPVEASAEELPTVDDPASSGGPSTRASVPPAVTEERQAVDGGGGAGGGAGADASPVPPRGDAAAPPLPTCTGHVEAEPNDTTAERLGGQVCGRLEGGDVDRFTFSIKERDQVSLAFALTGSATVTLEGAGTRVTATGKVIGPIAFRASKDDMVTFTLSKAAAPLIYNVILTR